MSLPVWITDHCQFGKHGEPFLWHGSGNDEVDITIMNLINLAHDDPKMAHEACELVDACIADSRRTPAPTPQSDEQRQRDAKLTYAEWCAYDEPCEKCIHPRCKNYDEQADA